MPNTLTYTVPPAYAGDTVQNFLRRDCGLSWRMVVKLKRVEKGITCDGIPLRTIDRLQEGQQLILRLPEDQVRVEGMDMPLTVVYEDAHLLVVDKPPYLAVHPSAGKPEPTLANAVVAHFQKNGEVLSFRPLNRLDRNTSGLVLVAKNAPAAYAMTGASQKEYLAVVRGKLEGQGVIDQPLRGKADSTIMQEVAADGKRSLTHWWALPGSELATPVKVILETGRTHQIRVHMAWLGYPLVGDTLYGTPDDRMLRHALHCGKLAFCHPMTGEELVFTAPLPKDMEEYLCLL